MKTQIAVISADKNQLIMEIVRHLRSMMKILRFRINKYPRFSDGIEKDDLCNWIS